MNLNRPESKLKDLNLVKLQKPVTSVPYHSYWRFAALRQQAFLARAKGLAGPWTDDDIINQYKFTNAYRASDRVSQYLIKQVIYNQQWDYANSFFRILLFKLFNKIETWQLLERHFGQICLENFNLNQYDQVLEQAINQGERIYSAAYIMPSGNQKKYGKLRKHRFHLQLLAGLIAQDFHLELQDCQTMEAGFKQLLSVDSFGKFLAYQLITDLNYSQHFDFSEVEFVMAGPGALDGIKKCFISLGDFTTSDTIKWMAQRQEYAFAKQTADHGITFHTLFGRPLQLIDCQNLFCEVDKYCRVAHPEIQGISGRTRIKQSFKPKTNGIDLFYPPKWQINHNINFD